MNVDGFAVVADPERLARTTSGTTAPLDDLLRVASGFEPLVTSALKRERTSATTSPAAAPAAQKNGQPVRFRRSAAIVAGG